MPQEGAQTHLHAPAALLPDAWARDVRVTIADGRIAAVTPGAAPAPGDLRLTGCALMPAMANLHSHAFQRAMAGMTEVRGAGEDSFWTWRELMYHFVARLTPEDVEAIAAQVQMEMLEAGYAAVAEFHYLHHRPGGARYDDVAEMSRRIVAAAETSGIGLTLLPVLYSHGGAGAAPLAGGQRRFGNGLDAFLRLMDAAREGLGADGAIGAAPHSLRATTPDQLAALAAALPEARLHIHAAEQRREVAEAEAWLGARPVRFLLDTVGIDARWCVIHATHMTPDETEGLARSGAVAGLCPITEANLGDGIFDGARYLGAGGGFGVGSDSNVRIALGEELRTLEYGQRLRDRVRNVLGPAGASVGGTLLRGALAGGARALGRDCGRIAPGALADLVAIDRTGDVLGPLADEQLPDGWIFATDDRVVREVWAAGRHVVRAGRHVTREAIAKDFHRAMARLMADDG